MEELKQLVKSAHWLSTSQSAVSAKLTLKTRCFQILSSAFSTKAQQSKMRTFQGLMLYLFGSMQICYFSSLLMSGFSQSGFVGLVKNILSLVRYDAFFVRFQWQTLFLIVNAGIVLLPYISFGLQLVFKLSNRTFPYQSVKYLIVWPIRYLQLFGFIPLLVLLQSNVYLSVFSLSSIYDGISPTPLQVDLLSCAFSILALISSFPLLVCGIFFDYNMYYNPKKRSFLARSRSFEYFLHFLCKVLIVTAVIWIGDRSNVWVEFISILAGFGSAEVLYSRRPFYDVGSNVVFTWTSVMLGVIGCARFVSRVADSEGIYVLVILFLSPSMLLLVKAVLGSQTTYQSSDLNFAEVERNIRSQIDELATDGHNKADISDLFKKYHRHIEVSQRISLLQASYFAYELSDPDKAWISLLKFSWGTNSLESEFQKFKLQQFLRKEFKTGEMAYIRDLISSEELVALDEQFCYVLLHYCSEMTNPNSEPGKCEELMDKVAKSMESTIKEYRNATSSQPKNAKLLYQFGTLLLEVLNDNSGAEFIQKAQTTEHYIKQKGVAEDSSQVFDFMGLMCMSTGKSDLGVIDLVNEKGLELLCFPKSDVIGGNINHYLPCTLSTLCLEVLKDVIFELQPVQVLSDLFSALMNSREFLMCVEVNVKTVVHNDDSFLFVSFAQKSLSKALIFADSEFTILANSENLSEFEPRVPKLNCSGLDLRDLFPDFFDRLALFQSGPNIIQQHLLGISFKLRKLRFGKSIFYMLSISSSKYDSRSRLSEITTVRRESLSHISKKEVQFESKVGRMESEVPQTESGLMPGTNNTETRVRAKLSVFDPSAISRDMKSEQLLLPVIKASSRRLKLFLLLALILIIICVVAAAIVMMNLIVTMEALDSLTQISQRRHLSLDIATLTHSLVAGIGVDENLTRSQLITDSNEYSASIDILKSQFSSMDPQLQSLYQNSNVPIHEKIVNVTHYSTVSLFDAMYKTVNAARAVANTPNITVSNPNVYFLLRNAPAEILTNLNRSMFLYVQSESELRDSKFALIEYLIYITGAILFVGLGVIVIPQVLLLEKHHKVIWEKINSIPLIQFIWKKREVSDRLIYIHNQEIFEQENSYKGKKKVQPSKSIVPMLLLKLSLIVVISGCYFFGVFLGLYPDLKLLLQTMPNYLNWGGLRSTSIIGANYWLRELYYQDTALGYFQVLNDNYESPSPALALQNFSSTLKFISSLFRTKNEQFGIYSAQDSVAYAEYRYHDACFQGNTIFGCEDKVESLGLNYALREYSEQMADFKSQVLTSQLSLHEVNLMGTEMTEVFQVAKNGLQFYIDQSAIAINNAKVIAIMSVVLYVCALLALYCLFYVRMTQQISRRLCDQTRIFKIIKSQSLSSN